jgi:hypothetical protein
MAAFGALRQVGGVDLEIGAGQIVEQHVEGDVEQIAPALRQMREQRLFVGEQPVVAGVELVRLGQAEVGAEQIGHGAVEEPLTMQAPFAARRDEPVGDQHLQHVVPARSFAASRQPFGPEAIELQLAPQDAGEPAGAPLARPAQPHLGEPQADHIVAFGSRAAILGEQGERARTPVVLVEHFDGLSPGFGL